MRRTVVMSLWRPQSLHHRYRILPCTNPKGLLGGTEHAAALTVRKDAEQRISAAALSQIRENAPRHGVPELVNSMTSCSADHEGAD